MKIPDAEPIKKTQESLQFRVPPFVTFWTSSSKHEIYGKKYIYMQEQSKKAWIRHGKLQSYHLEADSSKSSLLKKWRSTAFNEKHFIFQHSNWECFSHQIFWSSLRDFYNIVSLKCQSHILVYSNLVTCYAYLGSLINDQVLYFPTNKTKQYPGE